MITQNQKNDILALIEAEKNRLGSYAKVAVKLSISEASMSQLRSGKYNTEGDDIWLKIARALEFSLSDKTWNIVHTSHTRTIYGLLNMAKKNKLFVGISHRAGSGKSASTKNYEISNKTACVFRIECREWNKKEFLYKLCQTLGIEADKRYNSNLDVMLQDVTDFFNIRASQSPLLILDEADKLKSAALRLLIPLYNECEGKMGLVICGTENLKKDLERGVKYSVKGYDELHSRFGRRLVQLSGCTEGDIKSICEANGITDKRLQKQIFDESEPQAVLQENTMIKVVHDLRRVRRIIERELMKQAN